MKTKSFTLIELLVVIVIIGILAGVIIVSVNSSINKANFAKAQAFSSTVQNELLGDLVSEWTFDNASNPGEDTWGNNDGTVYGATYKTKADEECVYGGCYSFDGTNDYIDCGNNLNLLPSDGMTISIWIKPIVTTSHHQVFSSGYLHTIEGVRLGYINNVFSGYWIDSINGIKYIVADSNPELNKWSYVVFSLGSSGKSKMYINGVSQIDVKDFNGILRLSVQKTFIGQLPTQLFNGLIDDVRIYKAALSSAQIKQEYVAGLNSLLASDVISKEEYDQRLNKLAYEN